MLLVDRYQIRYSNVTKPDGFSLIEMAVVLAIVGLLLAGLLPTLSSQMDMKRINETRVQMDEIRASLIGFAVANGRLPCPDTDTPRDGIENVQAPSVTLNYPQAGQSTKTYSCTQSEGGLPYNQIGVSPLDPYNSAYIYRVQPAFAQKDEVYDSLNNLITTTYFSLTTNSSLIICNSQACALPRLTDNAVAVVVSKGKNWAQTPAIPSDENENINNNNDFVSHDFTPDFDDLVVWISPNTLFNRMVTAGKLP